jgi:predicted nucleic acid-binding protein
VPRVSFDSNVLIYAADELDARHERARELLDRAVAADCVLAVQALGEFYHVVTRKRIASVDLAQTQVEDWLTIYAICTGDAGTLGPAVHVNRHDGLAFWDAMLWATVKAAGCRVLLTEDLQDGRELGGVRFVNPFDAANDPLIDLVLPLAGEAS